MPNDDFTALRLPKELKAWAECQDGGVGAAIREAMWAAVMREKKYRKGGK